MSQRARVEDNCSIWGAGDLAATLSVIEVASGAALLRRLHRALNRSRREQVEPTTLRIVGELFLSETLTRNCHANTERLGQTQQINRTISGTSQANICFFVRHVS